MFSLDGRVAGVELDLAGTVEDDVGADRQLAQLISQPARSSSSILVVE